MLWTAVYHVIPFPIVILDCERQWQGQIIILKKSRKGKEQDRKAGQKADDCVAIICKDELSRKWADNI